MKKILIFITLLCILIAEPNNIFGQNQHKLSKEELFDIYCKKLKELKLPTVNMEGIKISEFNVVYDYDDSFQKYIPRVGSEKTKFSMSIDPDTKKVIKCHNGSARDYETLFEGGAKPTKNKEDIIKQAKSYLKIIYGEIPKDASLDEEGSEYIVTFWQDSKYSYEGDWVVYWQRKEGNYFYMNDCIGMTINERCGLVGYGYNFFSQYHPPKQINITKEKAIEIAQKHINDIINNPYWGGGYEKYKIGDIHSAELMIVNPNYITKRRKDFDPRPSPYARLAWVVSFNWLDRKTSKKITKLPPQVWIDAETGELLGGMN